MSSRKIAAGPTTPAAVVEEIEERLRLRLRDLDRPQAEQTLETLGRRAERALGQARRLEAERTGLLQQTVLADDYAALRRCHEALNAFETERFLEEGSVPALHRSCTEYRGLLAGRTLTLVARELEGSGHGPVPVPYALVSMGSDGREEQTLITDQDYLLVWADGGGEAADAYFRRFSELLVERLAEVGFKKCTGDIMPSNPTWRGSVTDWKKRLLAIVRYEYEEYSKNLMDLIVLSDARYVAGDREMADSLIRVIREFGQNYFQVLWQMAKAATEMKVALGLFRRLWTDRAGPYKGLINLKLLAWAPLVMNIRILAVNHAIAETSTLRRIDALERAGSLSPATAANLRQGYHLLTRHRIRLQIEALREGREDSYYLDPRTLDTQERERLRQTLLRVRELQKVIHTNFSIL